MREKKKAVILLSGGLDSAVCIAVAANSGYELLPISFDYQQRHVRELESAKLIANHYNASSHLIIETNLAAIGGSALTDQGIDVPQSNIEKDTIPITYVPARNLIFLSYALGYAEVNEANRIFIGVNSLDYSGYPDCRPEFIKLFQKLADYSTKAAALKKCKIVIDTPLLHLTKKDIVILGEKLEVPFHLTTSCYHGGEAACGQCDSCLLRMKGFNEAFIKDPIRYRGSE